MTYAKGTPSAAANIPKTPEHAESLGLLVFPMVFEVFPITITYPGALPGAAVGGAARPARARAETLFFQWVYKVSQQFRRSPRGRAAGPCPPPPNLKAPQKLGFACFPRFLHGFRITDTLTAPSPGPPISAEAGFCLFPMVSESSQEAATGTPPTLDFLKHPLFSLSTSALI